MTGKTGMKKTGIEALAPRRKEAIGEIVGDLSQVKSGPRGGPPVKQISLTFKVTPAQHRRLNEARLDENTTTQALLLKIAAFYFEKMHGTKF